MVGDEVCVGVSDHSLRAFSLSGDPLREMRGDWRDPYILRGINGRLFLVETHEESWAFDGEELSAAKRMLQRRILVLTPAGETLQVYDCRTRTVQDELDEPRLQSICHFEGKLLCATVSPRNRGFYCDHESHEVFALRGL